MINNIEKKINQEHNATNISQLIIKVAHELE